MVVNLRLVARLLCPAVFWFGLCGLIPAGWALVVKERLAAGCFIGAALCAVALSVLLHRVGRQARLNVTLRDLFVFTVSLWVLCILLAAIPLWLILDDLNFAGAIFESASALSCTGATAIAHLDGREQSVLLWRSMLQFFGGIGFVVAGAALLPSFLLGGLNLFKTESSSFDGQAKLTAHIKTMAIGLLLWYAATAILCTLCYMIAGLDWFLALNAALCTVATGGMMPLDASMNGLPAAVHYWAMLFMILGSLPFFVILSSISGNYLQVWRDEQVRGLFKIIVLTAFFVIASLIFINDYDFERALRVGLFNIISIISTTGFALEDFSAWNPFATYIFFIILAIGGCSGSTSGGIKVFRLQICYAMFKTQLTKALHPHQIIEPHYNGQLVSSALIRAVITYFVGYILLAILSSGVGVLLGLSLPDAITASISALSNVGPAMGTSLGPEANFSEVGTALHLLFSFDMLAGRLEIIPVLLCLSPRIWRL
ncbi:MAG: hypothetical protein IAA31_06615 [Candidatus Anaerobiospirillum merdipullorum]|uniref:Trk system potassium uptake protein n=1 Tax=Candidatus Anaerobiospirillum merdipullorum TaxID=2838450 RepID=A0A9E2KPY6_9GAMM|nr:hypothetical protein [Candidatus Anaerobiospirillum merdipullorum]